jgi:hypothetical protein
MGAAGRIDVGDRQEGLRQRGAVLHHADVTVAQNDHEPLAVARRSRGEDRVDEGPADVGERQRRMRRGGPDERGEQGW